MTISLLVGLVFIWPFVDETTYIWINPLHKNKYFFYYDIKKTLKTHHLLMFTRTAQTTIISKTHINHAHKWDKNVYRWTHGAQCVNAFTTWHYITFGILPYQSWWFAHLIRCCSTLRLHSQHPQWNPSLHSQNS